VSMALAGAILLAAMLALTHNRRSPGALEPRPRLLTTLHSRCFMAGSKSTLTAARLRDLLHYDPDTGLFTRLVRSAQSNRVGDIAGGITKARYIQVSVAGVLLYGHRLAVLYMTGEWPVGEVDHRDGDRSNNRWGNLREVDRSMNQQNLRRAQRNNQSGTLGVSPYFLTGRWCARIYVDGRVRRLGVFSTQQEAGEAYLEAKRQLHPGCTI
jgi:HNH endonuclease